MSVLLCWLKASSVPYGPYFSLSASHSSLSLRHCVAWALSADLLISDFRRSLAQRSIPRVLVLGTMKHDMALC